MGDDNGGEPGPFRLLELTLDEGPVLCVPLCGFARSEQPVPSPWCRMAPVKSASPCPTSRWAQASPATTLEQEVGPERRPDDARLADRDGPRVEQRHVMFQALPGELASRDVDFGPIELVVPGT